MDRCKCVCPHCSLPSWRLRDSNSRPPACKAGALPAELSPLLGSGSRLLSRTVSSAVPSAAPGLTFVFGMGTGVSPERIATGIPYLFLPQINSNAALTRFLRKEVIQPHLPIRLPCYDFTPVTRPAFDGSSPFGFGHRLRAFPTPMV